MVFPDSGRISRVRPYSGALWKINLFSPTGLSPSLAALSRVVWLIEIIFVLRSYNPLSRRIRFGLFPVRSPLLRESLFDFFYPGYLDVSVPLVSASFEAVRHYPYEVSPFGNLRVKACLAARRSLSQLAASFIGVLSQGIHSLHFFQWFNVIFRAFLWQSERITFKPLQYDLKLIKRIVLSI